MNKQAKKELTLVVQESISKTIEDNPGIEKYIDWFTIMAPINNEMSEIKNNLKREPVSV